MRTIVWFRGKDLRLRDHVPLAEAVAIGDVIPLFVLDPFFFAPARARDAPHRMQFLLDGLQELAAGLERRGSRLVLARGKSVVVVPRLLRRFRADKVVAHRWVEPFGRERDRRIAEQLGSRFQLYEGETLLPPGSLRTGSNRPYAVWTPFAKAFRAAATIDRPRAAPRRLPPIPPDIDIPRIEVPRCEDLGLVRNPRVLQGGERAARQRLSRFLRDNLVHYPDSRDRLDLAGTSRLSADIKFGTLSIRSIWSAVTAVSPTASRFVDELIWREFSYSTLWDRPGLLREPFNPKFTGFPWIDDEARWARWTSGRTGYPVVDAAARQLTSEGFVHNRARMISASFLAKHLLIAYRWGEEHYMKYLADGDWAQNNAGWQWSAGCGCDAQPYFRVFNPILQGRKFDPQGAYVRRWVPELAKLPPRYIHSPWEASTLALKEAGVVLGQNYPQPVVDHPAARGRFLALASRHLKSN
ncbi:MAG: deoxyribodipyrimidine photo-lyase [Myxococcales bacterium FL481]|nr:MAG: deoxyribodipyrimidine photo-lyase [Myxococcales bacterium FL481]